MIETLLASIGLLVCAALLLRMVLPARLRPGWDGFWRRCGWRLRTLVSSTGRAVTAGWQRLRGGRAARQQAAEVIARAQGRRPRPEVRHEGNVIHPQGFGRRRNTEHSRDDDRGDDRGDRSLH